MAVPQIRILSAEESVKLVPDLSRILMDCVEGGASVSFMAPLSQEKSDAFWRKTAASVAARERILIIAEINGEPVGTVQVVTDLPENQPHRADISKMLVHRKARNNGIGRALMEFAETAARQAGKTLLVLDTASDAAERLYLRQQWKLVGHIPGYALFPDGRPCATAVFYKEL